MSFKYPLERSTETPHTQWMVSGACVTAVVEGGTHDAGDKMHTSVVQPAAIHFRHDKRYKEVIIQLLMYLLSQLQ